MRTGRKRGEEADTPEAISAPPSPSRRSFLSLLCPRCCWWLGASRLAGRFLLLLWSPPFLFSPERLSSSAGYDSPTARCVSSSQPCCRWPGLAFSRCGCCCDLFFRSLRDSDDEPAEEDEVAETETDELITSSSSRSSSAPELPFL